ncbi:hypothetical protein [Paenibacillus sp. GCM10012303]|uniref:hypothetical protein n=1 Tax=Paenibacillus sp. GCM10012303 TaxID=3317340 RepID=UPI003614308E
MNGIDPVRIVKLAAGLQVIICLWILILFGFNGVLHHFITWDLSAGQRLLLLSFVSGVVLAAGSVGVLRGKRWGWWITVTMCIYLSFVSVQNLILPGPAIRPGVSLLVSFSLLILFFTAAVRRTYRVHRQKPAVLLIVSIGIGGMYRIAMWVISNSMVSS